MAARPPSGSGPAAEVARDLREDLTSALRGQVRADAGTRAAYSADASNYRVPPVLVALPADADDVVTAVQVARSHGVPVIARGAGTSIAGNAIGAGVVLDLRRLAGIREVDPAARCAWVQPGVVLDDLRCRAGEHGLTFGPDPSTHSRATLGGMIGNNACGAHSVAWGTTADQIDELEVVTAGGERMTVGSHDPPGWVAARAGSGSRAELYRGLDALVSANLDALRTGMPQLPRRVSGYGLDRLLPERRHHVAQALVGTEGTCAVVLQARVRLVRPPPSRVLLVLGFPDVLVAAASVPELLAQRPLTVESMDRRLVLLGAAHVAASLPAGECWLFVEVGGDGDRAAVTRAAGMARAVRGKAIEHVVVTDARAQRALWRAREDGAGLASRLPSLVTADQQAGAEPGGALGEPSRDVEAWPGFEDAAVPPLRLAAYLADLMALLRDHRLDGIVYGHFGEGCLHQRLTFDLRSPGGVARFRSFAEEAADLVVRHGGSVSGEHGDGRARSELLSRMYSPALLDCFAAFKALWDPQDLLNPGVIVRPAPLDADLRLRRLPLVAATRLAYGYRTDGGDLGKAVQRCVGVGHCVSDVPGGVMCPSWRATHDEQHSTRGRARILAEMLDGRLIAGGWRSAEVHEALDLCLGCKGCLSDCPADVDMATYKSEFLHQRYRRRLRPRAHYALGWLPLWLRLLARVPVGPGALRAAGKRRVLRRLAGLDPSRELPLPASAAFHPLPPHEEPSGAPLGPVVLWGDTFSRYLEPTVLAAGENLLGGLGFAVHHSPPAACCGLTWLASGQLNRARKVARAAARTMRELAASAPVVVLEPSCAAAIRHDLPALLPDDADIAALAARVRTLAEVLLPHARRLARVQDAGRLVVAPHCHQHSVLGLSAERELLRSLEPAEILDVGCCGLAGSFGLEQGHAGLSRDIARQRWLPALDAMAARDTLLADGFSCRTQVRELSAQRPVHLAQALKVRSGAAAGERTDAAAT